MALHRVFRLSSLLRSAVAVTLRRNVGLSAVVLNRLEVDPVQKMMFLDKIRDYNTKSNDAGGSEERHLSKMQQNGYENPTYKFFEQMHN